MFQLFGFYCRDFGPSCYVLTESNGMSSINLSAPPQQGLPGDSCTYPKAPKTTNNAYTLGPRVETQ